MEIEIIKETGRARLIVDGTIDEVGAENLKHRFREQNLSVFPEVVLDFRNVDYIGSAGIGKLLLFYKDISIQGGKLRIENLSRTVHDLLTELNMNSLFSLSKI